MPDWFINLGFSICGILFLIGLLSLTPIGNRLFKKKSITISSPIVPDGDYDNIYKIIQMEPSKNPPLFIDLPLIVCCTLILACGIYVMYIQIISNALSKTSTTNLLLFILLYIIIPLCFLVDTLILQRRQNKLGRSVVATKPKSISIRDNTDSIFGKTLRTINTMQGSIITMDRPKLVKAQLKGSIMTVTVRNLGHGYTRVNFVCDSQWVTTKIDFGKNKRYANTFEHLLLQKQKE